MTEPRHSITVRRLIHAPRTRVFAAFSRAQALSQWFTPRPDISVEVLAFSFERGGDFRLRFTMPDGSRPTVGGRYEHIAPSDQIAFSWMWEAPDPHAGIPTRVLVEFLEAGEATEVVITHDRLPTDDARTRYIHGWEGMLDRLEDMLAATRSSPSANAAISNTRGDGNA